MRLSRAQPDLHVTGTGPSAVQADPAVDCASGPGRQSLVNCYMELTKARLSGMVVLTTAVGFVLAAPPPLAWWPLLWTVLGTALVAGSANTFNQLMEVKRDRVMHRTRSRPLPSGRISLRHAFVFAVVIGYAGVSLLAILVNLPAAGLALVCLLLYVAVYTPLKTLTTLNTLVGAVCGAIPPVIGWVGASGRVEWGGWMLGGLLFIWQLPHFFALAYLYRDDYRRGGFAMLPCRDTDGRLTGQVAVVTSLVLLPIALFSPAVQLAGWLFALGGVILGGWICWCSLRFWQERCDSTARRLFRATLIYLSLALGLMLVDRTISSVSPVAASAADAGWTALAADDLLLGTDGRSTGLEVRSTPGR